MLDGLTVLTAEDLEPQRQRVALPRAQPGHLCLLKHNGSRTTTTKDLGKASRRTRRALGLATRCASGALTLNMQIPLSKWDLLLARIANTRLLYEDTYLRECAIKWHSDH